MSYDYTVTRHDYTVTHLMSYDYTVTHLMSYDYTVTHLSIGYTPR